MLIFLAFTPVNAKVQTMLELNLLTLNFGLPTTAVMAIITNVSLASR
jgi:hypothetical protein